jgi:hypothetical protein
MAAPEASPPADDDPDRPTLGTRIDNAFRSFVSFLGCGALIALGALLTMALGPGWSMALIVGLIAGGILTAIAVSRIRTRRALNAFRRAFGPLGKDLLLVTSDSPHWKDHIERHWLPRWGRRAVVINWSERSRWDGTRPEIALFRRLKEGLEYNPLAIVVAPEDYAIVRFWRPFRDFKHGKPARLDAAEARLALLLEALDRGRPFDSLPPEGEDPDERRESLRREFKQGSGAK